VARLQGEFAFSPEDLQAVDNRVRREVDDATDLAEQSPPPEPLDALVGIYASPATEQPLWFRSGKRAAVDQNERAEGWGAYQAGNGVPAVGRVAREND
jgi:hypothetical protein